MEPSKNMISPRASVLPFKKAVPALHPSVFVADGVRIIGDVAIAEGCGIWYNTVIRGDVNYVRIGASTNIQDNCTLHVNSGNFPLCIGECVTVGHGAVLHACTIEGYTLIGMNAVVLDGAVVQKHSMVAAGSVVRPGFTVPSGSLVAGIPAKVVRSLTPAEIEYFSVSAVNYQRYAEESAASII